MASKCSPARAAVVIPACNGTAADDSRLPGPSGRTDSVLPSHRAVGCQMVSSPVKAMLAVEWLKPGEGEDPAALRLLTRLPELYGSPFVDIILLDYLDAQAPVLKLAAPVGWDLVVSLKQQARELYQNAMGLFTHRPADQWCTIRQEGEQYAVSLWDTDGLPFTPDHPQPVRVVWSQETLTQNHYRRGQRVAETTEQQWLWVTT